jgi:CBS domain-containing protein
VLVSELMTSDVVAVDTECPLDAAVRLLADRRVSALPVVDRSGLVVGILSEADVLRLHLAADSRAHLRPLAATTTEEAAWPRFVDAVMTPDPVTVHRGADVSEVAACMADTGWKSIPVVDDHGALCGIVSRSDVIRVLGRADAEIWTQVVHDIASVAGEGCTVQVHRGVVTLSGLASESAARVAAAIASTAPGVRSVVVDSTPRDVRSGA